MTGECALDNTKFLFIYKVHFVRLNMYFNFVTSGLQILKQRTPQFQLRTFLSTYGLLCFLLLPLHALCISKAYITVHVVLEGHGDILQEKKAWDFIPENCV